MGFLALIIVIAVIGWAIFVQIGARQQVDVSTPLSEQEAAQRVTEYFGLLWTRVDGPGHLNYRPKLRMNPPTVSITFAPDGTAQCTVSIWMSHFSTRYGMIPHAQLAWRKKQALAARLREPVGASAQ